MDYTTLFETDERNTDVLPPTDMYQTSNDEWRDILRSIVLLERDDYHMRYVKHINNMFITPNITPYNSDTENSDESEDDYEP